LQIWDSAQPIVYDGTSHLAWDEVLQRAEGIVVARQALFILSSLVKGDVLTLIKKDLRASKYPT
jgi:hypothetical protein